MQDTRASYPASNGPVLYAIGDVHGEAGLLGDLHANIDSHHAEHHAGAAMRIIHLGDYVDRGPDSAGVIDLIIERQARAPEACLALMGNHEALMLDALTSGDDLAMWHWLVNGGEQTLASYRDGANSERLARHLDWMKRLPARHVEPAERMIFVHAGIDPRIWPAGDDTRFYWTRSARFFDVSRWNNPGLKGCTVVHGHTPQKNHATELVTHGSMRRINVDTGAVYGGPLTAVVLAPGADPHFLRA